MLETVINGIPEPVMAAEASSKRDLGLKLEGTRLPLSLPLVLLHVLRKITPKRRLELARQISSNDMLIFSSLTGIFTRLYNIEWKIPGLVELLGSYLDAMGPFLKHSQAAVPMVIEKLFALLVSLPAMRMVRQLINLAQSLRMTDVFYRYQSHDLLSEKTVCTL